MSGSAGLQSRQKSPDWKRPDLLGENPFNSDLRCCISATLWDTFS